MYRFWIKDLWVTIHHSYADSKTVWLILLLGLLQGCGSSSNGTTNNNCSSESLSQQRFQLVVQGDQFLHEGPQRNVRIEEVIIDGAPFAGITLPIPANVPRDLALTFTILARSNGPNSLPSCIGQRRLTLSPGDDERVTARLSSAETRLLLDPSSVSLRSGETAEATAVVLFGGDVDFALDVTDIATWSSGNPGIVTVSQEGQAKAVVTGVKEGNTIIRAKVEHLEGATEANVPLISDNPNTLSMSLLEVVEGTPGVRALTLTAQLTKPALNNLTVTYTTQAGLAEPGNGKDYCDPTVCESKNEIRGTISFTEGSQVSSPIRIAIVGDNIPEAQEQFTITLEPDDDNIETKQFNFTIIDDDGPFAAVFAKGVGFENENSDISLSLPKGDKYGLLVWNQGANNTPSITINGIRRKRGLCRPR